VNVQQPSSSRGSGAGEDGIVQHQHQGSYSPSPSPSPGPASGHAEPRQATKPGQGAHVDSHRDAGAAGARAGAPLGRRITDGGSGVVGGAIIGSGTAAAAGRPMQNHVCPPVAELGSGVDDGTEPPSPHAHHRRQQLMDATAAASGGEAPEFLQHGPPPAAAPAKGTGRKGRRPKQRSGEELLAPILALAHHGKGSFTRAAEAAVRKTSKLVVDALRKGACTPATLLAAVESAILGCAAPTPQRAPLDGPAGVAVWGQSGAAGGAAAGSNGDAGAEVGNAAGLPAKNSAAPPASKAGKSGAGKQKQAGGGADSGGVPSVVGWGGWCREQAWAQGTVVLLLQAVLAAGAELHSMQQPNQAQPTAQDPHQLPAPPAEPTLVEMLGQQLTSHLLQNLTAAPNAPAARTQQRIDPLGSGPDIQPSGALPLQVSEQAALAAALATLARLQSDRPAFRTLLMQVLGTVLPHGIACGVGAKAGRPGHIVPAAADVVPVVLAAVSAWPAALAAPAASAGAALQPISTTGTGTAAGSWVHDPLGSALSVAVQHVCSLVEDCSTGDGGRRGEEDVSGVDVSSSSDSDDDADSSDDSSDDTTVDEAHAQQGSGSHKRKRQHGRDSTAHKAAKLHGAGGPRSRQTSIMSLSLSANPVEGAQLVAGLAADLLALLPPPPTSTPATVDAQAAGASAMQSSWVATASYVLSILHAALPHVSAAGELNRDQGSGIQDRAQHSADGSMHLVSQCKAALQLLVACEDGFELVFTHVLRVLLSWIPHHPPPSRQHIVSVLSDVLHTVGQCHPPSTAAGVSACVGLCQGLASLLESAGAVPADEGAEAQHAEAAAETCAVNAASCITYVAQMTMSPATARVQGRHVKSAADGGGNGQLWEPQSRERMQSVLSSLKAWGRAHYDLLARLPPDVRSMLAEVVQGGGEAAQ
jgi:hypothetical protein